MMIVLSLAFIALLAPTSEASAQSHTDLEPGEEIRVRWKVSSPAFTYNASSFAIARVVEAGTGMLVLERGTRRFSVPVRSIQNLERRVGTRPASAPAMVKGSAIGFVAGFAAGLIKARMDSSVPANERFDSGLVSGVLLGAPAGAFLAWLTSRRRGIYERVPLHTRPELAVSPAGGVGVSLRLPTG